MPDQPPGAFGALWDWRRRVSALYAAVRSTADPATAWMAWRLGRDELFHSHPQSPVTAGFRGLAYYAYDPSLRFSVELVPASGEDLTLDAGEDGAVRLHRFARTVGLAGRLGGELSLFWMGGYGGGVFLPFADATSGSETYGAGRYLLDTIKGADLGMADGLTVLDFNFAYNPSCSYSPRYVCPLAPAENRLPMRIRAGECDPAV